MEVILNCHHTKMEKQYKEIKEVSREEVFLLALGKNQLNEISPEDPEDE